MNSRKKKRSFAASGQITVFFAISLLTVCALLLGLFESARTAGARLYLRQAVNSAAESLFSMYHRELWEGYRLLGLEHYSKRQLQEEFSSFAQPYFEVKDWYPMKLSEKPEITELAMLTDNEGEIYEKQILEYMKYGIFEELLGAENAEDILKDIKEAKGLSEIKKVYESRSKEAARLEESIEKLNSKLTEQKESYENALSEVRALNGGGLLRELKELKKQLEGVPPRVEDYKKKADALSVKLKEARTEYEEKKGGLSDSARAQMEAEIAEYEAYVDEDGKRRIEIESFPKRAQENIIFVERVEEVAREVLEYIESWEPEDEDDELDEEALWSPVESLLEGYDLLFLEISFGVADKEKEGFLENIGSFLKGNVLELLLPEGAVVSKEALPLGESPSETCFSGHDGCRVNLLERGLLTEYILSEFNYFGRDKYGKNPEKKGSGHMETEYILSGKQSDYKNLSEVVTFLIAVREGLNLIYLFSDSEKRNEARALAAVITGVAGFTPLISVMTFFILGVWALGQALCDIKHLLCGGKVPLMHNSQSWSLDLSGLLDIGKSGEVAGAQGGNEESGLSYKDWLRIFIYKDMGSLSDYRSMDIIQMNIKEKQPDFLLKRCAVSLGMTIKARSKHVLFSSGILNKAHADGSYNIVTETFYTYLP